MKSQTSVWGAAAFCAISFSVIAQEETAPAVPSFLQGLTERQLNSKPIQRFLYNYRLRANSDGSFPDAPGATVLPQINALSIANVTAFPYVLNSRWTALGP